MLEGWISSRSEQQCRDLIEAYALGGDGGITRRQACGLSTINENQIVAALKSNAVIQPVKPDKQAPSPRRTPDVTTDVVQQLVA
eukprot:1626517-Amphidinium_carterae.1